MYRDPYFILLGRSATGYSLRGLVYLAVLYVGAHFLGALISPPVYWLIQHWAAVSPNTLNRYLAGKEFPAYFERFRMLPILVGLPFLFKACGLWSWERIGYGAGASMRRFSVAAGIGIAMILPVILGQLGTGALVVNEHLSGLRILEAVGMALAGAVLVALVEELVFRGCVFRLFYSAMPPLAAVVAGAAFFAYVHFAAPDALWNAVPGRPVTFGAGFFCAFNDLRGVFLSFRADVFFMLFLVGLLLNLVFLRMRSLWPCAGLHAGWVFVNLLQRSLLKTGVAAGGSWLGAKTVQSNPIALLIVGGVIAFVFLRPCESSERC